MWRFLLLAGFLAAIAGAGVYIMRVQHKADTGQVLTASARAGEKVARKTIGIMQDETRLEDAVGFVADDGRQEALAAPGADAPVPADVLAGWRAGIAGVRRAAGDDLRPCPGRADGSVPKSGS